MKLNGYQPISMIDFPGMVASVVFVPGCNYNCPACHAKKIIKSTKLEDEKDFFSYLDSQKGWIDGVVLCGGEPTEQPYNELEDFLKKIKGRKLKTKLDTNGSNPRILEKLIKDNLIDYVAMDFKAPFKLYPLITGKTDVVTAKIGDSAKILTLEKQRKRDEFDYEFRTTVAPIIRENNSNNISFMTVEEVVELAKDIIKVTGSKEHNYYLQKFVPREDELNDSRLENFQETRAELLEKMKQAVSKYLLNVKIRGGY